WSLLHRAARHDRERFSTLAHPCGITPLSGPTALWPEEPLVVLHANCESPRPAISRSTRSGTRALASSPRHSSPRQLTGRLKGHSLSFREIVLTEKSVVLPEAEDIHEIFAKTLSSRHGSGWRDVPR